VGKPQGKRLLERPRHRWEDGIGMDVGDIGWGNVEWIQLAQDRGWWWAVVNVVMNLWILVPCSYLVSSKQRVSKQQTKIQRKCFI
jgi:hypothetical protein